MLPQQYCLRWKYHHSNLQTMFSQLLDRGCFCDVTLACEGQVIRAHRVVLCACSTYFDTILTNYAAERDPIIIMKDAKFSDVKCLIEFMYKGEINVEHANLASLLKTAEELKIKGLAEVSWREDEIEPTPLEPEPKYTENIDQQIPNQEHIPRMPLLTPIPSPNHQENSHAGPKRKRGRPPLDEEYDVFSTPKISYVETPTVPFNEIPHVVEQPVIDETVKEQTPQPDDWTNQDLDSQMNPDLESENDIMAKSEPSNEFFTHGDEQEDSDSTDPGSTCNFHLTPQEQEEWKDVVKMDAYLARGRRPQFWEESFTKKVMEAIKTKELEMKKAAQLLGVSYGTLYGRYRETYGCLKHPYRSGNMSNFRSLQI